jgi:hypothetical protein
MPRVSSEFLPYGRPPQKKPPIPKQTGPKPNSLVPMFDELNALWNQAEADLAEMRVPFTVSHLVDRSYFGEENVTMTGEKRVLLKWTRCQNQWRLCWAEETHFDDHDDFASEEKPIAECPMEIRVQMTRHFKDLKQKVKKAQADYLPEVSLAIAELKEALGE